MSRKLCKGLAFEPWKTVNTVQVYLAAFALIKDLASQQSDVSKALETSTILNRLLYSFAHASPTWEYTLLRPGCAVEHDRRRREKSPFGMIVIPGIRITNFN